MTEMSILLRSPSLTRHSVIPAPYQVRGKLQRESRKKIGFLVKPGMTKQGKCLYNYGLINKSDGYAF
jgi:hypothetical protein